MAFLSTVCIVVKREFNFAVYTAMAVALFQKTMARVMQEHGLALPELVVSMQDIPMSHTCQRWANLFMQYGCGVVVRRGASILAKCFQKHKVSYPFLEHVAAY